MTCLWGPPKVSNDPWTGPSRADESQTRPDTTGQDRDARQGKDGLAMIW